MSRKNFLSIASIIATLIGLFAIIFPTQFLASKGTIPSLAADLWMREFGIILFGIGLIAWFIRNHDDNLTIKYFLLGNVPIQIMLMTIELIALSQGVITKISGIIPSTIINTFLAIGFWHFGSKIKIQNNASLGNKI